MAVDKLVDSTQLNADLTSVANAIRTKGGTSAQMAFPNGFVSAIRDIPSGGGFTPPAGIEIGKVDVVSDSLSLTINHSLGVVPKYAIILMAINGNYADIPYTTGQGNPLIFEELASDPETGVFDKSLGSGRYRDSVVGINTSSDFSQFSVTNTYSTVPAAMSDTEVTFATGRYYSIKFWGGMTYVYMIMV